MSSIAISLIACGCIFNCCAIGYLLLEKHQRGLQKKRFQKNLEEIEYHLHRARNSGRLTKRSLPKERQIANAEQADCR
jgi:hypothetical protein